MKKGIKIVLLTVVTFALLLSFGSETKQAQNDIDYRFASLIKKAAEKYNVPAALIAAIIKAESNFNPRAKSYMDAHGLMQIGPSTRVHLKIKNAFDPAENIYAGTKYFSYLLKYFDGNLKLALAAYNAGPTNVKKYGDVPPFGQTRRYIPKVLKFYSEFSGMDA